MKLTCNTTFSFHLILLYYLCNEDDGLFIYHQLTGIC